MSFRPQITRSNRRENSRGRIPKHAVGIDHRSGFKVLLKNLKFEPGTNFLVTADENDWDNSLIMHPQNFPPEKKHERIALRWSFPDSKLSIGAVVSAEQLFLPTYASVCNHFIQFASANNPPVSSGSGVSVCIGLGVSTPGDRLDFSIENNSMYYIIIFPGI